MDATVHGKSLILFLFNQFYVYQKRNNPEAYWNLGEFGLFGFTRLFTTDSVLHESAEQHLVFFSVKVCSFKTSFGFKSLFHADLWPPLLVQRRSRLPVTGIVKNWKCVFKETSIFMWISLIHPNLVTVLCSCHRTLLSCPAETQVILLKALAWSTNRK